MKSYKKVIAALLLPLALIGSNTSLAAGVPDEQFVVGNPPTDDRYTGINLADTKFAPGSQSLLEAFTADGTSGNSSILTKFQCQKIGDKGCESEKYFRYDALLGLCDTSITTNCVSEVFATDSSGKRVVGKFVENFPGTTQYTFAGDPSVGLPAGASSFIVDFPDFPHQGGTQYLLVAALQGARGFNRQQFVIENYNSAIFAVTKVAGSFGAPGPEFNIRPDHKLQGRQSTAGDLTCAKTTRTACALAWPLPLDVSFGYTLKMREKIKGWFHGRLYDAQAEITKASDGDQLLTIQGKPSIVPGIHVWYKKSAYPAPLQKFYSTIPQVVVDTNGRGWGSNSGKSDGPDGLPYSILKEGFGYDSGGFREVSAWIDSLGDKATYAPTVWSIRSMESQDYESCMKGSDTLSGIVSTNSTMYIGNPPTFNSSDQTLDYKVMSPHYLPDGTEFKGSYDLMIRSDVARCIYGFSSAPISATISVISSDGTAQVATTLVREKNGWLSLSAKNFTFSAPVVKVSLKQAGSKAAKKSTITCIKGKITKKVTGSKPACPAGYKKR
ncbi:hypothetical protein MCEMRE203_01101 [Candidatus Nanopelagicaceae bacterium]